MRSATAPWASASSTTSPSQHVGHRRSSGSAASQSSTGTCTTANGTQDIVADDPTIFFASLHEWPLYPGTGGADEQSETLLNIPLRPGTGDEGYSEAWSTVERAVLRFGPELLLVSAGFDAHVEDPLAHMQVTAAGFADLARRASTLAPRVAAVLEGGYNLETLPDLVGAALDGFNLNRP